MAFVWPSPGERPKKADGVTFYAQAGEDVAIDAYAAALLRAGQLKQYNPYGVSRPSFYDPGVTTHTAALAFTIGAKHGASATTSGELAIGDGSSSPWVWMADSTDAVDGVDVLGYLDVGRWIRQGSSGSTTYVVPGHGVVGTGLVDDRPALAALDAIILALGGGTITFAPGTYRLDSTLAFSSTTAVEMQRGAQFVIPSGSTLSFGGSFSAPSGAHVFDISASVIPTTPVASTALWSKVNLAGKAGIMATWFGARDDSGVTDNHKPLTIWANSIVGTALASAGGELVLDSFLNGYFATTGLIIARSVNGGVLGNLTVRGTRGFGSRIRHTVDATSITNPEGLGVLTLKFESGSNANIPYNLVVEDISIEGNSGADRSKAIYFGFFNNAFFNRVQIRDTGGEGICSPGASTQVFQSLSYCRAINIGREGLVAAWNINAQDAHISHCTTEYCGRDIEHTGKDFFVDHCTFKYADAISMMMCSSVFANGRGTVSNTVVVGAPTGAAVALQSVTDGMVTFHDCLFVDCDNGVNTGVTQYCKGSTVVHHCMFLNGSASGTAILLNRGKNAARDNTIQRIHGATGIVTAAAPTATLNGGATTGTWADKQYTGTVSSATGLSVGGWIAFAGDNHIYRITGISGLNVTLHKPKYGAAAAVALSYPHILTFIGTAAASGNGLYIASIYKNYTTTVAGLAGTYTVLDTDQEFVGASNLTVRVDASPNTTVANALATYSSSPWAYAVRSAFDEGNVIERNHTIGLAWTTAWCAQTGWLNTTTENNAFDLDGQDPTGMTVLQVRDSSDNEAGRLRHGVGVGDLCGFDCQQPWGYSGTRQSFGVADSWPVSLTWKLRDCWYYRVPTSPGFIGETCVGAGTRGTLAGKTGTITTLTDDLTVIPNASTLVPGMYLSIATVDAGASKRIESISGAVADLDSNNGSATATGQAVSFFAPTLTTWGPIT